MDHDLEKHLLDEIENLKQRIGALSKQKNPGIRMKKSVDCEQCFVQFNPFNNKQRFCTKDCAQLAKRNLNTGKELTQEYLHEILDYNPETGIFIWRQKLAQRIEIGQRAGCFDPHSGYRFINIASKNYREHKLAWFYQYGELPKILDHINRAKDDNRLANLRPATESENKANSKLYKSNKSGYRGVTKVREKWAAKCGSEWYTFGFNTAYEAAIAYNFMADYQYGEFAQLNQVYIR